VTATPLAARQLQWMRSAGMGSRQMPRILMSVVRLPARDATAIRYPVVSYGP